MSDEKEPYWLKGAVQRIKKVIDEQIIMHLIAIGDKTECNCIICKDNEKKEKSGN